MRLAVVLLALAVDPRSIPIDQLTRMSGDFGGVRVPEIAPKCGAAAEDPATHIRCAADKGGAPRGLLEGAIFTAAIGVYTAAQRQASRSGVTPAGASAGSGVVTKKLRIPLFCDAYAYPFWTT